MKKFIAEIASKSAYGVAKLSHVSKKFGIGELNAPKEFK